MTNEKAAQLVRRGKYQPLDNPQSYIQAYMNLRYWTLRRLSSATPSKGDAKKWAEAVRHLQRQQ